MNKRTEVTIIGGGAAGLTAAYDLHKKGRKVVVLEAAERTGGVIASRHVEGFDLDLGPNSLQVTTALEELIKALGLESAVLEAAPVSRNRYLVKQKRLYALSPHPLALLKSPYLSLAAKGRLLTERFRPKGGSEDQSVGAFFARRFGHEICQAMVDPIFSGIYAGDIDKLSLEQVLPIAARWEKTYGSVTKGLLQEKGALKTGRRVINFEGGLERLVSALAAPVSAFIETNARVTDVRSTAGGYRVTYARGGEDHVLESSHLIWAAPLNTLAGLSLFEGLRGTFGEVDYASVRVLHVALPQDNLRLPAGFGFLVPSRERLSLLGCIFSSSVFPSKAPQGQVLLTVMTGGAHQAAAVESQVLERDALNDLRDILHIQGEVRVLHAHTWNRAIPQKNLGYAWLLQVLEAFEQSHPRFRFVGSALSGVSVGDCMAYASQAAAAIL